MEKVVVFPGIFLERGKIGAVYTTDDYVVLTTACTLLQEDFQEQHNITKRNIAKVMVLRDILDEFAEIASEKGLLKDKAYRVTIDYNRNPDLYLSVLTWGLHMEIYKAIRLAEESGKMQAELLKQLGWRLDEKGKHLIHEGEIPVTVITDGELDAHIVEPKKTGWYVKGVKVKLTKRITTVEIEEANHPNFKPGKNKLPRQIDLTSISAIHTVLSTAVVDQDTIDRILYGGQEEEHCEEEPYEEADLDTEEEEERPRTRNIWTVNSVWEV
ncbi:hypothetical protein [Pyrococcus kukulkanii]|uniref:hypothetical protein n=1 Tax=Pyrococcus kukulkanii TaxID=1609559 RepID=UPI003567277E